MSFANRLKEAFVALKSSRHRLFWKIMLIFWGTLFITIITNTTLTRYVAKQEFERRLESEQIHEIGQNAANLYESGGTQPLERFLNRIHRERGIKALLMNAEGAPLTHNAFAQRLMKQLRPNNGPLTWPRHEPMPLDPAMRFEFPGKGQPLHIPVESTQGSKYHLVIFRSPLSRELVNPEQIRGLRLISTFIVIALASWFLSRHLNRPILALSRASKQMANGNLSVRTRPDVGGRKDELGAMSDAFDHMAEKIQSLVTAQQQLFRNLSHEIRTPLTRQKLALELLRRQDPDNPMLARLESNNEEIEQLTQQILDLTKLQSPTVALQQERIALAELVSELVANNTLEAEHKQVHIKLTTPQTNSGNHLRGDPTLLYRAMENVLRNAIKHAPESSIVTLTTNLSATRSATATVLRITDEGPGVPESQLEAIFDPFFRVDSARNRSLGGFGLGLAFAREVIEKHGGHISAANRENGPSGLVVTITLPLAVC